VGESFIGDKTKGVIVIVDKARHLIQQRTGRNIEEIAPRTHRDFLKNALNRAFLRTVATRLVFARTTIIHIDAKSRVFDPHVDAARAGFEVVARNRVSIVSVSIGWPLDEITGSKKQETGACIRTEGVMLTQTS